MKNLYFRYSSVKSSYEKAKVHHELVGNFFANQLRNAQNLIYILSREGNPYEYADLRNLMNFSVPRSNICHDVCNRDELGVKALNKFRQERMVYVNGESDHENEDTKIPFWSPLTKNNFQMFSDIHIVVNGKQKTLTTLKIEKQLYARMLFVSKSRPELCPETVIGEFEFTNIPPSNFSPDGSMITVKSNDSLIKLIMELPVIDDEDMFFEMPTDENSVIIVNAMEILESIKKQKQKPMENVSDLVNQFLSELEKAVEGYSEVRLIFERFAVKHVNEYDPKARISKKAAIHYHVKNNTPIKSLDSFLAHVNTRVELSTFLGQLVFERYKDSPTKYLVAYGNKYLVNESLAEATNLGTEHDLVDLKQIILSNVADISKINRNRILTINSTDVDLIILLTGLFQHIPPYTTAKWDRKSIKIMDIYNRLSYKLSDSIIGWYAFHGK